MGDSKSTQIVSVSKLIMCLKSPNDAVFVSFVTKNSAHGLFVSSSANEQKREPTIQYVLMERLHICAYTRTASLDRQ